MRDLTTAEHHGQLDLVPLLQKAPSMARLECIVVLLNPRPELDLLHLHVVLLLLCITRSALLFVPELPEIHDLDDGRTSFGGDLNEVQSLVRCSLTGFIQRDDTDLFTVVADQSNRTDSDLLVDSGPLIFNGPFFLRCSHAMSGNPDGTIQKNPD